MAAITIHGFRLLKYLVNVQPIATSQELSSMFSRMQILQLLPPNTVCITNAFFVKQTLICLIINTVWNIFSYFDLQRSQV